MKTLHKIALAAVLVLGVGTVHAGVVVVVGAKSAVISLDKAQVSDIFLGKVATFPSGAQAVPVDQAEGSGQREEFHAKVTGKNGAQLSAYWSKLVFSGKASPPKEVPGEADVKVLVTANPNLIGYIDSAAVDASVRVVFAP
ncbi:MAG: phosphate ABC transporter substrate-binding protein [Porticoccaceae bacterium]|nr:MAG: phosphate ABC transporter substrate-binding protein [Porticoccaceae bacterium]